MAKQDPLSDLRAEVATKLKAAERRVREVRKLMAAAKKDVYEWRGRLRQVDAAVAHVAEAIEPAEALDRVRRGVY